MSMFDRFDAWLGLRVFQPPAILLCWLLRCTQHRLNRDMWFAWLLWFAWDIAGDPTSTWWQIGLMLIFCAFGGLGAALIRPEIPAPSLQWFRFVLLLFVFVDLTSGRWIDVAGGVWLLIAEYAATITDLPKPPSLRVRRRASRTT